jgi:hypothetical protein
MDRLIVHLKGTSAQSWKLAAVLLLPVLFLMGLSAAVMP